jgi:hypothetical protein
MNVKGVQLTLCDIPSSLTLGSQSPEPDPIRAPGFLVAANDVAGCVEVIIVSLTGDLITPGTGPILTLYCDVDSIAPVCSDISMQLTAYNVSDENHNALPVIPEDGNFKVGVKGDLTGDCGCDLFDVLRQINIVLDKPPVPTPCELWAGDMDDDGDIDLFDILMEINCILGRTECACASSEGASAAEPEPEAEVAIETEALTLRNKGNILSVPVELTNEDAVMGLYFQLSHIPEGLELLTINLADGLEEFHVDFNQVNREVKVILVSVGGELIAAGKGPIMSLVFEASAPKTQRRHGFGVFKNVQAAGEENKPVKAKLKIK